jgi:hypothetical protein
MLEVEAVPRSCVRTFEQFADDAVGWTVVRQTTQNGPVLPLSMRKLVILTRVCCIWRASAADIATPQLLMSVCCVLLFSWR